jgi:hypothetical protein
MWVCFLGFYLPTVKNIEAVISCSTKIVVNTLESNFDKRLYVYMLRLLLISSMDCTLMSMGQSQIAAKALAQLVDCVSEQHWVNERMAPETISMFLSFDMPKFQLRVLEAVALALTYSTSQRLFELKFRYATALFTNDVPTTTEDLLNMDRLLEKIILPRLAEDEFYSKTTKSVIPNNPQGRKFQVLFLGHCLHRLTKLTASFAKPEPGSSLNIRQRLRDHLKHPYEVLIRTDTLDPAIHGLTAAVRVCFTLVEQSIEVRHEAFH